MFLLAPRAPAIGPLAVDRQPPRHPYEPRPKAVPIAELTEAAIRLDERLLGDVLGILAVPQHAERHPKSERGRLDEPRLEIPFALLIHA